MLKIKETLFFFYVSLMGMFFLGVSSVEATTYYVSPSGDDAHAGTSSSTAVKTFSKAVSFLQAGDELRVMDGTYNEPLEVSANGTAQAPIKITADAGASPVIDLNDQDGPNIRLSGDHLEISGIEARESDDICVLMTGDHQVARNLKVHECYDHGIYTEGDTILIEGNDVSRASMYNEDRTAGSGWASLIKLRLGANNVIVRNNRVYDGYGEGIAVTRATNVIVQNNEVFDTFSVNIYVDNSYDVVVDGNFTYCTSESAYDKLGGGEPAGISLAEEHYSGWGAQLARVDVINNIIAFCSRGITYFGSDVSGGGLDNVLIAHNTIYGTDSTALSIGQEPAKTRNTLIANNIIHHAQSGQPASIADRTGITMRNNLWSTALAGWMNASGNGDIIGDPGIQTVPSSDNPDPNHYALLDTSLAIDTGGSLSPFPIITHDYSIANRDNQPDIGAHEFGAGGGTIPSPTPDPSPSVSPSPSPSGGVSPSPEPDTCTRADINLDGEVNLVDYTHLINNFFQTTINPARADITQDGFVNLLDYAALTPYFLESC